MHSVVWLDNVAIMLVCVCVDGCVCVGGTQCQEMEGEQK